MKANPALTVEGAREQIQRESPELFVAAGLKSASAGVWNARRERLAAGFLHVLGSLALVGVGWVWLTFLVFDLAGSGSGKTAIIWGWALAVITLVAVAAGYISQRSRIIFPLVVAGWLLSLIVVVTLDL